MNRSQKEHLTSNPEVSLPKQKTRKKHTAEYKLRILKEADLRRSETGGIASILRREGLYSSVITQWGRQRDNGTLATFSQKRGRRANLTSHDAEIIRLKEQVLDLEKQLRQSNLIIEVQKKISELFGSPITLERNM